MGRPARIVARGLDYHVLARCNNREALFGEPAERAGFLALLSAAKAAHGFRLYGYAILGDHVHLFLGPRAASLPVVMRGLMAAQAKAYNRARGRKGHFWEDRYKAAVVEGGEWALACLRYLDRNPVQEGVVVAPEAWPWSAYRFYALGEPNPLLDPHPAYLALGASAAVRQERYEALAGGLFSPERDRVEPDLEGGPGFGSPDFLARFGALRRRRRRRIDGAEVPSHRGAAPPSLTPTPARPGPTLRDVATTRVGRVLGGEVVPGAQLTAAEGGDA